MFGSQQVKLAEQLELEGVDVIQTEGGKCSNPSKSGILGLIEKVMTIEPLKFFLLVYKNM